MDKEKAAPAPKRESGKENLSSISIAQSTHFVKVSDVLHALKEDDETPTEWSKGYNAALGDMKTVIKGLKKYRAEEDDVWSRLRRDCEDPNSGLSACEYNVPGPNGGRYLISIMYRETSKR